MLTRRTSRVLAVACLACTAVLTVPARATPDSPPVNSTPAEPTDIPALVRQLGDADFRTREAAHKRLREIGKPAMPALREALGGDDPEVCSRADSLLRQIERPRIPSGWFTDPTGWRRNELLRNGTRVVEIFEGDRLVQVSEGPSGIEMNVRGEDDGTPINLTIRARDASDLRLQDPEAHAVYERVIRVRSGVILRGRRIVPAVPLPPVPMPRQVPMPRLMPEGLPPGMIQPLRPAPRPPAVRLLPLAPEGGLLRPPADDLLGLEARLRGQMRAAGVEAPEQQAVLDALRMLREIQTEGRLLPPADFEAQIQKYNALSDALRQKLDDLKLPGPGDALPPPARARLGISVETPVAGNNSGGVRVKAVIPGGRGEKLGLRDGDEILRVNGRRVFDPATLRRVLTDATDPLLLDVLRSGEPLVLKEKAP